MFIQGFSSPRVCAMVNTLYLLFPLSVDAFALRTNYLCCLLLNSLSPMNRKALPSRVANESQSLERTVLLDLHPC